MCNDIGEAAYTDSLIAAALYEHLARLPKVRLLTAMHASLILVLSGLAASTQRAHLHTACLPPQAAADCWHVPVGAQVVKGPQLCSSSPVLAQLFYGRQAKLHNRHTACSSWHHP